MKKILYALAGIAMLTSCQEGQTVSSLTQSQSLSKLDLNGLKATETTSKLTAFLTTESGSLVKSPTDIRTNTNYKLTVKSTGQNLYVVRQTDGFEVLSTSSTNENTTYSIKSNSVVPERLYISIVPVVKENNVLKRQAAQSFLLPTN